MNGVREATKRRARPTSTDVAVERPVKRPWPVKVLVALLVFQGVGAVGGGGVLVADPSGEMLGWDTSMLDNAPFTDFLWPGLILGVGLGLSALVLAWAVVRRPSWGLFAPVERRTGQHWSWLGAIGLGVGLMSWIVVQVVLVGSYSFLQPLMFAVGAALAIVPFLPGARRQVVPRAERT